MCRGRERYMGSSDCAARLLAPKDLSGGSPGALKSRKADRFAVGFAPSLASG